METPSFRMTGSVVLLAVVMLLVFQLPGRSIQSGEDEGGPPGPTALEERFDIDFAQARADASPDVDLMIDRADLDAWLDARMANPDLFDGLVIGVVLPNGDGGAAERAAADLAAGRDPETLTDEERAAVARAGGPPAEALDAAAHAAEDSDRPASEAPPPKPCEGNSASTAASDDEIVVYFACRGDEPIARPEVRSTTAVVTSDEEKVQTALGQLATVSAHGRRDGLYTVFEVDSTDMSVSIDSDVAHIAFEDGVLKESLSHSVAQSTMFLEQLVNTVFANTDVSRVELSLGGDCDAFWQAMGGDGCHHASRSAGTNTRGDR